MSAGRLLKNDQIDNFSDLAKGGKSGEVQGFNYLNASIQA
jgi:hypothetical protein